MHFGMVEAMAARLDETEQALLKEIWAPREVAVPPMDTWSNLCVTPEGEIRSYGREPYAGGWRRVYLASQDAGLSWKKHWIRAGNPLGRAVRSPWSGRYLNVAVFRPDMPEAQGRQGVYAQIADHPDSEAVSWYRVTDEPVMSIRQSVPLRHRRRWVVAGQVYEDGGHEQPIVMYSDDDGKSWSSVRVKPAPRHQISGPHKGFRWQNDSCEPTVAELSDGRLIMLARTSQDYHYQYFSEDGGETWSDPAPSPFHGTLTMPTLERLSDGRLMLFWCNTQPLPELDHRTQWPPLDEGEIQGLWEDVFTNRDANHAAISEDDGKTWIGLREVALNGLRNESDFRTRGANDDTRDKSVHQFEAVELPFGKVLLSYGQHPACRRMVILDPGWLYETERSEDFRTGLAHVSTQVYVKSVSGNFRGFSGHCAWNRTHGALMVPDPDGNFEEALLISRIDDPRLFSPLQGAVWNFPASRRGLVTVRLRIEGEGLRLSLIDRWLNPIDEQIACDAPFTCLLTADCLPNGQWSDVNLGWDLDRQKAWISVNGGPEEGHPLACDAPLGISYLHLQSAAQQRDDRGAMVKFMKKTAL